jgi:hypothetical protein
MSLLIQAQTSDDDAEIFKCLDFVLRSSKLGLVHESVNVNALSSYTRKSIHSCESVGIRWLTCFVQGAGLPGRTASSPRPSWILRSGNRILSSGRTSRMKYSGLKTSSGPNIRVCEGRLIHKLCCKVAATVFLPSTARRCMIAVAAEAGRWTRQHCVLGVLVCLLGLIC